jgi:hypothetical protein
MRARFINEIKQDIERSGLGSIGIGSAGMTKAYKYAKAAWPNYIANNEKPMDKVFSNKKFKYLSRLEDKFKISMNDYMWLNWPPNINQAFDDWLHSIKFDKTLAINPSEWNCTDARIVKYNYEWNIGYLSISNDLFDNHKIHGYFFKYK